MEGKPELRGGRRRRRLGRDTATSDEGFRGWMAALFCGQRGRTTCYVPAGRSRRTLDTGVVRNKRNEYIFDESKKERCKFWVGRFVDV